MSLYLRPASLTPTIGNRLFFSTKSGNVLFVTPKLHDSVKVEFETGTSPDQFKIDDCGNASMKALRELEDSNLIPERE
jgi:hypothetical protein